MKVFSMDEVAKHNTKDSCWLVISGKVYDITSFLPDHPGGKKAPLIYAGGDAERLAVGAAHAGLKTISTGARKHLVDTQHVVRVAADADVVALLAAVVEEVLVAGNARGLKGLGGELLLLAGHHVDGVGGLVHDGALGADVEDADLRVRHTTAVARLDERHLVLETVALGRTATHGREET